MLKWRSVIVKGFGSGGVLKVVQGANAGVRVKCRPAVFRLSHSFLLALSLYFPDAVSLPLCIDLLQMFPGWNGERRKVMLFRCVDADF